MSYLGNSVLSAIYVGSTAYSAIYVGSTQVFGKKVEIIFHLNYDNLIYRTVKLNSDKTVTIPSAPTRDKYTFEGWYLNSDCTGNAITSSTTFTQSTTVYAKWTQATIAVESISLDKSTASIAVGKTVVLTATVSPSNASNKTITWSTNNSSVATVSNGTVTGKSSGTTTITATSNNGKSASCSVTVQATGSNGWVGSANAGAISMDSTSFTASGGYADVNNETSAYVSSLRYRVYNSDGLTYTDYTPTISYSWLVSGAGLSVEQGNIANTSATYASRGATVGAARSGTIKRRATFTYGSYSTSLDSNTISVTQAANSSTKVIDNIEYGKPSTPRTNNSTKGVGAWTATYTSSVTNKQHWHYTYTSGYVGGAETPTNITGTVSWSISWQECPGGNRFSISTSGVVSHTSMTTNAGIDQATVKATNAEDSSKSASASISTETNVVTNSVTERDTSNTSGKNITETEYEINNISLSCTYSEIIAAGGSQYPSTSYNYDLTSTTKTKYATRYKYTYSTGSIGYTDWTTDGVNWQYGTPETRTLNQGGTIKYSCTNQISTSPKFILESTSNGKVTADNLGTTSYPNGRSIPISVEFSFSTNGATGTKTITTTVSQGKNVESSIKTNRDSYTLAIKNGSGNKISYNVGTGNIITFSNLDGDANTVYFIRYEAVSYKYTTFTSGSTRYYNWAGTSVVSSKDYTVEYVKPNKNTPTSGSAYLSVNDYPSTGSSDLLGSVILTMNANTSQQSREAMVTINASGQTTYYIKLQQNAATVKPETTYTIAGTMYKKSDKNYVGSAGGQEFFLISRVIQVTNPGSNAQVVYQWIIACQDKPSRDVTVRGTFVLNNKTYPSNSSSYNVTISSTNPITIGSKEQNNQTNVYGHLFTAVANVSLTSHKLTVS